MIFDILKDATDYTSYNMKYVGFIGLLYLFSFLIIPVFVIEGLTYNIISSSLNGTINIKEEITTPRINLELFRNSLKMIIVKFVYLLPFLAVYTYGVLEFSLISSYVDEYVLLELFLFIIGFFLYSIGIVHMVYHESLFRAFDIIGIVKIIREIGAGIYFKLFTSMLIVIIGSTVLAAFIIAILSLIITWFVIVDFKLLTLLLSILSVLIILLPVYTVFKNRAISSIYNLR